MARISAEEFGEQFLTVLREIGASALIGTKQEALLFLAGWFGNELHAQSAGFNKVLFREEALKALYFTSNTAS